MIEVMSWLKEGLKRSVRAVVARGSLRHLNAALFRLGTVGLGVGPADPQQPEERNFLRRHVNAAKPVIFDVGANIGQYATMALSVLPNAKITSFEPHPNAFAKLIDLAGRKGFIAINCAVGDRSGTINLFDCTADVGTELASTVPGVIERIHGESPAAREVPLVSLDDFLREHEVPHIDLLKIDVEGAELAVLRGAREAISQHRIGAIQLEFNEMNTVSKTFVGDLLQELPGFHIYRLLYNGDLLDITHRHPLYREIFGFQNLVALPASR